ncbi:MAG: hypothetical protein R3F56_25220 [Planctomycetota bacterium]
MPTIFDEALPMLLPALAPAFAILLAPLCGSRARTAFATAFLLAAAFLTGDILLIDHSHTATLDVPNVFFSVETGTPREWIVAHESAPAWAWHVVVIVWFGVHGLTLLLRRRRPPAAPHPVLHGAALFWIYLAVRLALEKTAAWRSLVWAVGSAPALLLMLPFLGWYAGRRHWSFAAFAGALLGLAVLQRLPLIAFGYLATTRHLGTHLDTHLVTEMRGLFGGVQLGDDAVRTWTWTTLVPHATLWVAITLIAGLVLGFFPWRWARRRAGR